jgi:hypothetical protein
LHWAYKIFVKKQAFQSGEALPKPELYASMLLNPEDNKDNLPADYISDILDALPEKQKARFRDGLWVKAEGVIYDQFAEDMILDPGELPETFDRFAAGGGESSPLYGAWHRAPGEFSKIGKFMLKKVENSHISDILVLHKGKW